MAKGGTTDAPNGLAGGIPRIRPTTVTAPRRDRLTEGLARRILARLPAAVLVVDAEAALAFWNEQASVLFGCPPHMVTETPLLADMLARVGHLTQPQREQIVAFAQAHIARGDRVEPDGRLQLTLGRGWRVVIQVHGLGIGRWMLVFNDSKSIGPAVPTAAGSGDAWLDTLTGLSSRRHFTTMLQQAVEGAAIDRRHAVLLLDLDRFAAINQAFGRPVGDALLCVVAQRLRREARDDDVLARLGGDKFAWLLTNRDGAESLAARSVDILARPFLVDGHRVTISASVGMVRIPDHGTVAEVLMQHADIALSQAKSAGGRTWCLFDAAMLEEARDHRALETDFRKALARHALSLVYQPFGQGSSNQLNDLEAQPRWDHATRGLVPASVVMKLAATCGLGGALGEWMLKTACAEAATWPEPKSPTGQSAPVVVVPITSQQLQERDGLEADVRLALAESGLPSARLALKIPAAWLANRQPELLAALRRLGTLGVRIVTADGAVSAATLGGPVDEAGPPDLLTDVGRHPACDYSGSSLTSTSGVVELLQRHAKLTNSDP